MLVSTPETGHIPERTRQRVPIFKEVRPHPEPMRDDPAADPVRAIPDPRDETGRDRSPRVPERGLEPPPSYLDKNLNLARLPIPPLGRVDR